MNKCKFDAIYEKDMSKDLFAEGITYEAETGKFYQLVYLKMKVLEWTYDPDTQIAKFVEYKDMPTGSEMQEGWGVAHRINPET